MAKINVVTTQQSLATKSSGSTPIKIIEAERSAWSFVKHEYTAQYTKFIDGLVSCAVKLKNQFMEKHKELEGVMNFADGFIKGGFWDFFFYNLCFRMYNKPKERRGVWFIYTLLEEYLGENGLNIHYDIDTFHILFPEHKDKTDRATVAKAVADAVEAPLSSFLFEVKAVVEEDMSAPLESIQDILIGIDKHGILTTTYVPLPSVVKQALNLFTSIISVLTHDIYNNVMRFKKDSLQWKELSEEATIDMIRGTNAEHVFNSFSDSLRRMLFEVLPTKSVEGFRDAIENCEKDVPSKDREELFLRYTNHLDGCAYTLYNVFSRERVYKPLQGEACPIHLNLSEGSLQRIYARVTKHLSRYLFSRDPDYLEFEITDPDSGVKYIFRDIYICAVIESLGDAKFPIKGIHIKPSHDKKGEIETAVEIAEEICFIPSDCWS